MNIKFMKLLKIYKKKNNADYIIANLLDRIGNRKHFAMIIDKDGIITKCNTKLEIENTISKLIFN